MNLEAKVARFARAIFAFLVGLHRDEAGQEAVEYLVATAGFAVVFAGAFLLGIEFVVPRVLDLLCSTVDPLGSGSCLS